jgi:outer membrane lipoprotein-sorting protein
MRVALSAALLGAACCAGAAPPLAPAELMPALAAVTASRATFVETKRSALLKEPLVTRGTLAYRRPDSLEKHVREPYDERIVLDGGRLTIDNRTRGRKTTVSLADAPQLGALAGAVRAVRAGDLATLELHFELRAEGAPGRWTLSLTPRAEEVARYVAAIFVSGAAGRITRIEIAEAGGDRSVMDIQEEIQ